MIFVGIDNGLSGGIVAMDSNEKIIVNLVMPVQKIGKTEYDTGEIVSCFRILKLHSETKKDKMVAILEKAHVRPVSGKRASFMTGFGYGLMQGILESLFIPYEIVTPQTWMKELGINSKDKKGSIMFCKRRFPTIDWTATERSKKIHDGKTDACALALFGLRRYKWEKE